MKILIAFYSRTGGTEKVAEVFKKELERRGHSIDVERVKPVQEHGFWGWFFLRIFKKECKIQPPAVKDASKYDAVCVGSPNWTRLSLPVARYLREVTGLKEKRVVFFSATAFLPSIEWYFFSAYFLDLTFSRIIKQKGGRIIGSILLSSKFKKWDFASKYGENAIKGLCDKIETPISSLKDFNLKQREIEETRFLVVILSLFLLFSLIFQIGTWISHKQFLNWTEYLSLFLLGSFTCFLMLIMLGRKGRVFLGKYLAGISFTISWTLVVLFLAPALDRLIISV